MAQKVEVLVGVSAVYRWVMEETLNWIVSCLPSHALTEAFPHC